MRTVDIHSHVTPLAFLDVLRSGSEDFGFRVVDGGGAQPMLVTHLGHSLPLTPSHYSSEARISDMDMAGVDLSLLSIGPTTFCYHLDPPKALQVSRLINDSIAEMVAEHPSRFAGLATVPLQDPPRAATELRRAVETLGLVGVEIGANIDGLELSSRDLDPFWEAVHQIGCPVLIHPYFLGARPSMGKYYLSNLVGNPLDTTLAACHLVFGGVLERYPGLRLILSHAGGYFPYGFGRLQHGFNVRQEVRESLSHPPSELLSAFYFDTIAHSVKALEYLVESFGADRVLMGSDYPFDMADPAPVRTVMALKCGSEAKAGILGSNAAKLFGLRV